MAGAGEADLAVNDILLLHHVHHRGCSKKLADICFTLNYEDTHVINYYLKKLMTMQLISGEQSCKEVFYTTTPAGVALVERFRDVRNRCLLTTMAGEVKDGEVLSNIAR
ncbi:MAG: winged helix DNA-binding protein [Candidatus Malihini olakiniferum]